jgi:hypothetical protein
MLTFPLHYRAAWNDYFTISNPKNLNSQTYSSRQTISDAYVYVLNCLFSSITSTSDGGALCTTSTTYLLIESTSFFSCRTSDDYGGAIYFSNTNNGQCVLYRVCGYDCYSTYTDYSNGQFAHLNVNNSLTSKNYVNCSSITRCINQISNSHGALSPYNGKVYCTSINLSMNKCPYGSAVYSYPFSDSNSVTCSLTYSSFTDNTATVSICLYLYTYSANYEIKSCNIIRNIQGNLGSLGIIRTSGNMIIENSCILENKANTIFYESYSSCIITISNCTVDSTSKYGSVEIQNTVTKSFILALSHISTRHCHSEYDSAGTLTPITPLPASPKQQICLCSSGNSSCQSQLRYLVSLISVFMFTFIHLDASIYTL